MCLKCGKSWGGFAACHCVVCHETFSSYNAANFHWGTGKSNKAPAADAKHLHPSESPKLVQNEKGIWHQAGAHPRAKRLPAVSTGGVEKPAGTQRVRSGPPDGR